MDCGCIKKEKSESILVCYLFGHFVALVLCCCPDCVTQVDLVGHLEGYGMEYGF